MENLKQDLELLYNLQEYDIKIAALRNHIAGIPVIISSKQKEIENKKTEIEVKKKDFVDLNSLKKEKEALLDSKEKAIAKNSMELNSVKSNDTYKALLLEIEKAKADKSVVEDEILELMLKIDSESSIVKNAENDFKNFEQKLKSEITELENSVKKDEESIAGIEKEREEYKHKVSPKILEQYERIREGRDGQGIVLVDGESCGGCSMVLRPQLINQAHKCNELVFCDNCSRILLKK
ncbi:MAG: C4-type zinc ribbon domain-containing protein [Endomicrobia bacterium]|nr:C4-type zinc ribbon domain-containing protein [Endomicrobiia bacterium]MCL2799117.1 C4-type zinc ribbon domain-containing protein [Endomicrobiia bacterium]